MKISNISFEKLLNITVELMIQNSLKSLSDIHVTRNKESNNIWNLICQKYYGSVDYLKTVNFYNWYKRNTRSYASQAILIVSELLQKGLAEPMETDQIIESQKIVIPIQSREWTIFQNYTADYNGRTKLKAEFTDILSERIQKFGINCWLKCEYNWFKAISSQKKLAPFWHGRYVCVDIKCKNKFEALIEEPIFDINKNQSVLIFINYFGVNKHEKNLTRKIRCSGKERNRQARELVQEGTCNSIVKNINNNSFVDNRYDKKTTDCYVLGNIKYEFKNRNKISNEIFNDCEIVKLITDSICLSSKTSLNGYIHEIGLNPFGFLLISDIQLQIWEIIEAEHSVLYFDATGSIHKKIRFQKKPFFYSLVFHDLKKKLLISLADFVSTANDQNSIGKYLFAIKNILIQNNRKFPRIIVTDMSWALINSVLLTFNNCNIQNYINWCYIYLTTKESKEFSNVIKVKVYLCSTHFFKNIKQKTKNINCNNEIKIFFLFMFTLIQNSINLVEIDGHLKNIYNIFCSKYLDESVINSIYNSNDEIKNKQIDKKDIMDERLLDEQLSRDKDFEDFIKASNIFMSVDNEQSIKNNSPFKNYFDQKILTFSLFMDRENSKNVYNLNSLYCPEIFGILKEQLYLIPLWSGLMIHQEPIAYDINTRLTNNPVENYFSQVKNYKFNKRKDLSASEIVSTLYKDINAKFITNYEKKPIDLAKTSDLKFEKWVDKNKKIKRFKGFYFKNYDLLKLKTVQDNLNNALLIKNKIELSELKKIEIDSDNDIIEMVIDKTNLIENENIFLSQKKLMIIKTLINTIEHKTIGFKSIKFNMLKNKTLLECFVKEFRSLSKITKFNGQVVYEDFKKKLALPDNFYPIFSTGNGNCLYNSISILLFERQDLFYLIKICSIYVLLIKDNFFKNVFESFKMNTTYEKFIQDSCKPYEYGTEINLLALSILLNRDIHSYVQTKKTDNNVKHVYSFMKSDHQPLLIGLCNLHFFPILSENNSIIQKPCLVLEEFDFKDRFTSY